MIRLGPVLLLAACSAHPADMCTPRNEGGPFCVPDSGLAANIDAKLELKDNCSSMCDHGSVSCVVRFDGGTSIGLALVGMTCITPGVSCTDVCVEKTYTCALPALPDGTYTVTSTGQTSQTLMVGPGGSPSCAVQ